MRPEAEVAGILMTIPEVFQMEQHLDEILPFATWLSAFPLQRIVEIGVRHGGTSALWATLFPAAQVIGIDRRGHDSLGGEGFDARARMLEARYPNYTFVEGDSAAPTTVDRVQQHLQGPIDFLFLDGDHSYIGVRTDLTTYRPAMAPGGVIAFHDITPSAFMQAVGHGVWRLWQELPEPKRAFCQGRDWGGIGVITV